MNNVLIVKEQNSKWFCRKPAINNKRVKPMRSQDVKLSIKPLEIGACGGEK